jgi:hypothetical protein
MPRSTTNASRSWNPRDRPVAVGGLTRPSKAGAADPRPWARALLPTGQGWRPVSDIPVRLQSDPVMPDQLYLYCGWWTKPTRLGEFAEQLVSYLKALAAVDPIFGEGEVLAARLRKDIRIGIAQLDLAERLIEYLDVPDDRDYTPPAGFTDRGPDGQTTAASTHRLGIDFAYNTLGRERDQVIVTIHDGMWGESEDTGNVTVRFPENGDPRLRSLTLAESVLRASVASWRPSAGWLTRRSLRAAVQDGGGDWTLVGWRTYLGSPSAIKHLPKDADVERIAPGGTLVKLHGGSLDASDPDLVRAACRVRDALMGRAIGRALGGRNFLSPPPQSEVFGRGLTDIDIP